MLPRTGIRWSLPTKRNFYDVPLERIGIPVEAYLAEPGAPAEQVVRWLDAWRPRKRAR